MSNEAARVVETHLSTLFFVDDVVYKRKKAIRTDFVDFTDLAVRRDACQHEVDLNRRLAPDVYLGVADVVIEGDLVDCFVVMRQLPADRRLSARLDRVDVGQELDALAALVVEFHEHAVGGPEIDRAASVEAVTRLWDEGLEQVQPFVGAVVDPADAARIGDLVHEYVRGRADLFAYRVADGCAIDGHGDIQAEDVFCLDDGPRVLDCLEFDDRLRFGDALNDVAFLAMDLERLGHPELATVFLDRYRELSGDGWPRSLEHFYIAYRAHVRAKVACIRHGQGDEASADLARSFHDLALRHLEAGRVRLVMVGGAPGVGKSSVAHELAHRLDARWLSSDVVRDELQPRRQQPEGANGSVGTHLSDADAVHGGRYAGDAVEAVYDELLRRARLLLTHGESVVLDASWLRESRRSLARELAASTATELVQLRCECPDAVADARIELRRLAHTDPSEATVEVADTLRAQADAWPDAVVIDTSGDLDRSIAAAVVAVTGSGPSAA